MSINLTKNQILNLMQEIPENHWFQQILLEDLNEKFVHTETQPITPEDAQPVLNKTTTPTNFNFPPPFKYFGGQKPPQGVNECQWENYGCVCGADTATGENFCKYHAEKVCNVCAAPAVKGCPTEYQFVCGTPLCADHHRCRGCLNR